MHRPPTDRPPSDAPQGRIEPSLDLDALERAAPGPPRARSASAAAAPRPPWLLWGGAVVLVAVLVMLLVFRQPLADRLWPETRAQQLRLEARQALVEGRLTSRDGSGARELYEAALALEPDRLEARQGLTAVGRAALAKAEAAARDGRFEDAHAALTLAGQLGVPRGELQQVREDLRSREAGSADVDQWLVAAESARRAGQLVGDDHAALPLYARVLALQPDRIGALEGREDALSDLVQQAWAAMRGGKLERAGRLLREARSYDPGHVDLPDALAELARRVERERVLAAGELRQGRLAAARGRWHALLQVDPDDGVARRGLEDVARGYAGQAGRDASDFRFEEAEASLREAERTLAWIPGSDIDLEATRRRLRHAREAQARVQSAAGPAIGGEEREQRLLRLLRQARVAQERGELLTPPGESAYDRLSAARTLAPRDPRVVEASARMLPASLACFEDALRGNRLGQAGRCLQAFEALGGEAPEVAGARTRLALRWIAVGDERLGAGELAMAAAAAEAARALDPGVAGLGEFEARVQAAAAVE